MKKRTIVYTIGHSTRLIGEFIRLLKAYEITHLIDIRTLPGSRFAPQFNQQRLKKSLERAHIRYTHMKGLGGLRRAKANSINKAWRSKTFRGYADYMQTKEFEKNLKRLLRYAAKDRVVIMCAEAVPWRCHRSLVGDALLAHKAVSIDILSSTQARKHKLTSFARVIGKRVVYDNFSAC